MRALSMAVLFVVLLAGCSDAPETPTDVEDVEVTETTGGIRGVVVDESITPMADVKVRLSDGQEMVTDETGVFTFSKLDPSTYFILASRIGYQEVQSSVVVEAGQVNSGIRVQLARLPGVDPYADPLTFDGFYECGYAIWVQTDSCDWVIRTVHDAGVPVPRGIQNNVNTEYYTMPGTANTIIQEGWYDAAATETFRFSVAAAPIDNLCDCSHVYLVHIGEDGYSIGRLESGGDWPPVDEQYAVRGFLPFQDNPQDVDYAFNVQFQIITTTFHNWVPAEGWNFEERDKYPAP